MAAGAWWMLIAACQSERRPPGVPAEAALLSAPSGALTLSGEGDLGLAFPNALSADPTDASDPELAAKLAPIAGKPLAIALPGDTPVWALRKVVGSARQAGVGATWLAVSGAGEAFAVTPPPKYALGGRCDVADREVIGAEPLITVSVQAGSDGAWVLAAARFIPVTRSGPIDGLPAGCLTVPACDALFPAGSGPDAQALRETCEGSHSWPPDRLGLGGEVGCLLPIARQPADVAKWRPELARVLTRLGIDDDALVVVMPEANTRFDAVAAVLGGFVDAGRPPPALGLTLLVEGNDGPPTCTAEIRDRAALAKAGAAWLGFQRGIIPPEPLSPPVDAAVDAPSEQTP